MPQFYFDVQLGANLLPDGTGLKLDTLEAADNEATRSALEIARHELLKAGISKVSVTVRNGRRQRLLTVVVSMSVDREISQPEPSPRSVLSTNVNPVNGN